MTDGQTDGQTEFSSLYRVCISCSAVKMTSLEDSGDDNKLKLQKHRVNIPLELIMHVHDRLYLKWHRVHFGC